MTQSETNEQAATETLTSLIVTALKYTVFLLALLFALIANPTDSSPVAVIDRLTRAGHGKDVQKLIGWAVLSAWALPKAIRGTEAAWKKLWPRLCARK